MLYFLHKRGNMIIISVVFSENVNRFSVVFFFFFFSAVASFFRLNSGKLNVLSA